MARRIPLLLRSLRAQLPEMKATLRRYVEQESPSGDSAAIEKLIAMIAADFAPLSPCVRLHRLGEYGPALQMDFAGAPRARRILLLGHSDTVYPLGTLAQMPWRERGGRLYGPGVFDMKAGIVLALFALRALSGGPHSFEGGPHLPSFGKCGGQPKCAAQILPCPITLLLVPDEEIGSPASQRLTERCARRANAVLVLEPAAAPNGACKTSRKGVGRYTLRVEGRAAHSGLDFESGASAIVEAAHQITAISALSRPARGLTLNPGIISGGSRVNVVAASAEVEIDVRFRTAAQAMQVDAALRRLKPRDPRCKLHWEGGMERPPFERSRETVQLYRLAANAAKEIGFELGEAAVGGASDGNFTSALGIPTLDGLGAVGDHAHSPEEFVVVRELPLRAALLAELIQAFATE